MLIKLVRHGESLANVGALDPVEVGDHTIGLTPVGKEQARRAAYRHPASGRVASGAERVPRTAAVHHRGEREAAARVHDLLRPELPSPTRPHHAGAA